jgi:hypothetical protein
MLDERLIATKLKIMIFALITEEAKSLRSKYLTYIKYPFGYFIGKKYLIKSQALFDLSSKISSTKLHSKELAISGFTLVPLEEYERLKQLETTINRG